MLDFFIDTLGWMNEHPIIYKIGMIIFGIYCIYSIFKPLFTGKDPDDGGLPWLPF